MFRRYNHDLFNDSIQRLINKIAQFPWIAVFLIAGVILRITGFTVGGIWYDEMFSLQMTHQGLWEMIESLKMNISPPGFEVLLWFLTHIFGWNAFSLRLISVVASILTLWVVIKITRLLNFSQGQQIAILALVALLPFQLIIAQQGRVYALFALLYLIGLYAALSGKWFWLGFSISCMLWCHNISYLFFPGLVLISFLLYPRAWKKILVAIFFAFIIFLPWLGVSLAQTGMPTPWFVNLTPIAFSLDIYTSLFGWLLPNNILINLLISLGVVILCLGGILISMISWISWMIRTSRLKSKPAIHPFSKTASAQDDYLYIASGIKDGSGEKRWILFIAFMLPLIFMVIISLSFKNLILNRTLFLVTVPFLMWLVHIYVLPTPNLFYIIVWIVSLAVVFTGLFTWTPTEQGGNMEQFSTIVGEGIQPGDVFYHDTGLSAMVFMYYFPNNKNYLMNGDNVLGLIDLKEAKIPFVQLSPENIHAHRVWVVWTHSKDLTVINKSADEETQWLVAKCPLITKLHYPQSWDVEIFLCDFQNR